MSRALLMFRLSLKRSWKLLFATGFLIGIFQVLRVHIAASVHEAGEFEQIASLLPPAIRAIILPRSSTVSVTALSCLTIGAP